MNQTFRDYLQEAVKSPAEIAEEILEHCMPFVNAVGDVDYGNILYRGTESKLQDFEIRHRTAQGGGVASKYQGERAATLGDFLKNKCGMEMHQVIFVTNDLEHAKTFGNPFIVFPVGTFKYAFSKTNKVVTNINSPEEMEAAKYLCGVVDDESEDGMSDPLFLSGIENNSEVLIHASGYYPIQLSYWKQNGQKIMENLAFR